MKYTYKIPGKHTPSAIFRNLANKNSVVFVLPQTFSHIIQYKIAAGIQKRRRYTEATKFSGPLKERVAPYITPFNKLIVYLIHRRRKISDEHISLLA